jgi:Ca-activated chloride channel homolog
MLASSRIRIGVVFAKIDECATLVRNPGDIQNQLLFTGSAGRTSLLDAVYLALQYSKSARNPRRALLVISDGGENQSRYTENEIRRLIEEGDTWIYAIGIYEHRTPILPEEELGGPALLTRLAEATGGRQFEVRNLSDLPQVAAKIGLALRNQYLLAFRPGDGDRDGRYHRLQVKLMPSGHFRVSAKPGYYAPSR